MFTPKQYRAKAVEYGKLGKTSTGSNERREFQQSFTALADNEQWHEGNNHKTRHAPESHGASGPHSAAMPPNHRITLSFGENEICVAPGADLTKFIRQIVKHASEVQHVLEQAEKIGSRIKRRPYSEYLDEIEETGLARVESHGFGLFVDGKLIFHPNHQVAFVRPQGADLF
jgi:hypothetical protein